MTKTQSIALGSILYLFGHGLSWFLSNSQLVWDWWKDKPFITCMIYAIPASMLFWYGTKYSYAGLGEAWGARLLAFGLSYLTFPILTYVFLRESMFTPKTLSWIFLSFCIVGIQIFWR